MSSDYLMQCIKYQKILFSPLKNEGFIPESGSEIFVRNIPVEDTEWDLLTFFKTVGEIFQIRLMMHENGVENRGFAYVTYLKSDIAKEAVTILSDKMYKGKYYLKIELSLNNCRLFIGGISTEKTKDQVWQEMYKNGVTNIVDVIMYRSYTNRAKNRGFVFVEFKTHEEAAYVRARFGRSLHLWNNPVIVDWSVPIPMIDDAIMDTVRVLYLRNLDVSDSPEEFQATILQFTNRQNLEKVYKFKNYAFVHLKTREAAEKMKILLEDYYKNTFVEIAWAKPSNKYTSPEYRQKKVSSLSLRPSTSQPTSPKSKMCNSSGIIRNIQNEFRSPVFNEDASIQSHYSENLQQRTSPTDCQSGSPLRPVMRSSLPNVGTPRTHLPKDANSECYCSKPMSPRDISCVERNCIINNLCLGLGNQCMSATLPLDVPHRPQFQPCFVQNRGSTTLSPNHMFNVTPVFRPEQTSLSPCPHDCSLPALSLPRYGSTSSFSFDMLESPLNYDTPQSPLFISRASTPSSFFGSGLPSPVPMTARCSTPLYSPLFSQSSQIDPIIDYQRRTSDLFMDNTVSSRNSISYSDAKILPRNLDNEHLFDLTGLIGDILD